MYWKSKQSKLLAIHCDTINGRMAFVRLGLDRGTGGPVKCDAASDKRTNSPPLRQRPLAW